MRFLTKKIQEMSANIAVCYIFEDSLEISPMFEYLNSLSNGTLCKQVFEYKMNKGNFLESFKMAINNEVTALVVGLGKQCELTRKKFSQVVANTSRLAKNISKNAAIAFELPICQIPKADIAQITITASRIGLYEFNKYLKEKIEKIDTIEIIDDNLTVEIEKNILIGAYSSFAMKFTKDLVNESAQVATPSYISRVAEQIATDYNLEIKVYDKKQIKALNMNAFLAVGQGSKHEPKFIHLTYRPIGTPKKKIALVGKGITFDAGGMNIKPAASMLTMKDDMTGAASVLGIIQAIAKLKPQIELHVISALCENMTSGSAYKQGDVLTAMNGKTIEVDNTDAEGRITLADALCYADTLGVDEVIDIATLTGAVVVALGNNITGVLGNNQQQIDNFKKCAELSCENVWQMPILDELKDNLKSEIADFKNTGGRNAGTSTAAWFLSNFTQSTSWMHLDIAGTAWLDKSNKETLSGPTGVMVRSIIRYLLTI